MGEPDPSQPGDLGHDGYLCLDETGTAGEIGFVLGSLQRVV